MKKEYKVIQLSPTHYLFVDDSEIKEGDWIYVKELNKIYQAAKPWFWKKESSPKKITHSTQPLEGVKHIPLSEVEEAIFGYSVEKMAQETTKKYINEREKQTAFLEYIDGFKALQELSKDKVFTLEDIEEAFNEGVSYGIDKGVPFEKYKKKLLPKKEWCVKFDEQGKLKLV